MKSKKQTVRFLASLFALLLIVPCVVSGQEKNQPPQIPVGMDAYRMWQDLPIQRIGARAYMRSTYDRT